MEKIKELRMTAIILLVGLFLLSGCLFPSKYEVTFKTNGGSEVKSASVKVAIKWKYLRLQQKKVMFLKVGI